MLSWLYGNAIPGVPVHISLCMFVKFCLSYGVSKISYGVTLTYVSVQKDPKDRLSANELMVLILPFIFVEVIIDQLHVVTVCNSMKCRGILSSLCTMTRMLI